MTLRLNGSSSGFTEIDAPAAAGSNTFTLPTSNGSAEQFLKNSGTAGELEFSSMVETSTGVGIGTSSPSHNLDILSTSSGTTVSARVGSTATSGVNNANLIINNGGTGNATLRFDYESSTNRASIGVTQSQQALFLQTAGSERMRIDNTGRTILLGTSTNGTLVAETTQGAASNKNIIVGGHSASSIDSGTACFVVLSNGNVVNTNNSYGALSDVKLKENIVDASSQWDDIKAVQVRNYNLKESTGQQTHTQLGVVAQEIEAVSPGLVSDSPDLDADGNDLGTVTKSVNYSVLYMKAVKALQEAQTRIETLEAKVAALEAAE